MAKSRTFTASSQYLYLGASEDASSHSVIQITGSFTATLTFQGSMDGSTWTDVQAINLLTGGAITGATATGIFRLDTSGMFAARVACTAYSSGSPTATVSSTGG